jgi:membrane-associated protein
MDLLQGLPGSAAVVLLCALLFAEEAGVPLPFLPGDMLLVVSGLLIATGTVNPLISVPLTFVAIVAGAIVGYSWARRMGARGLRSLAERLHAVKALDRVSERLRSAGAARIAISRLMPGLRIYTTLVAGAVGIRQRDFLLGAIPAAALWVGSFTLLGALVGVPAEQVLRNVDQLAVRGAALLLVGAGAYLAALHVPAAASRLAISRGSRSWRLPAALAVDLGIVGSIAAGLGLVARLVFHTEDPNGFFDSLAIFAVLALAYIFVSRRGVGATAGEAMLAVNYRPTT